MVPSTPQDNPHKKVAFATVGPAPVRSLFPTKERRQELWGKGEKPKGEKSKDQTLPLPPSAKQRATEDRASKEDKASQDLLKVLIYTLFILFLLFTLFFRSFPIFERRLTYFKLIIDFRLCYLNDFFNIFSF